MEKPVSELADNDGLECRTVSVELGGRRIVADATLSVARGRLTAVLGVSGSGKSTLLRAIAGFTPLASGHVRLGGVDLVDLAPEERPIGSLFQSARLFPALTVQSNVAFGLRVRGVGRTTRTARADELLEQVGLADRRHDRVTTLSGGEQQRVALARALAFNPELLLMDEPFSAVDTPRRRKLRDLVASLRAEHNTTALLVTHDIEDAKRLADRIAVIDGGRIVQEGPIDEVLLAPLNDTVADVVSGSGLTLLD